jgi:hypothetical protein
VHLSADLQAHGAPRGCRPQSLANRLARVLGKPCCAGVPIFDLIGEIAALAHACPADHELRAGAVRRWLDRLRPADFDDRSAAGD